LEEHVWLW